MSKQKSTSNPSAGSDEFNFDKYQNTPPKSASEAIAFLEGFLGRSNLYMALGSKLEGPGVPIMHDFLAQCREKTFGKSKKDAAEALNKKLFPDGMTELGFLSLITQFLENQITGLAFYHSDMTKKMFEQVFSVFENLKVSATHNKLDAEGNAPKMIEEGEDTDTDWKTIMANRAKGDKNDKT